MKQSKWIVTIMLAIACVVVLAMKHPVVSFNVLDHFYLIDEDALVDKLMNMDINDVILEFKELELADHGKNYENLIPYATVLIERKEELSEEEILAYLETSHDYPLLQEVLVEAHARNGYDSANISMYLSEDTVDVNVKYMIVAQGSFGDDELADIFKNADSIEAVAAMKRLRATNPEKAAQLAKDVILNDRSGTAQLKASTVAISDYCKMHMEDRPGECEEIINRMWGTIGSTSDEWLHDNMVYALARIGDFNVFSDIINNEELDDNLKIAANDYNKDAMVEVLAGEVSDEDLKTIIKAMEILPFKIVGEAMQKAMNEGKIQHDGLEELIQYTINEGVEPYHGEN